MVTEYGLYKVYQFYSHAFGIPSSVLDSAPSLSTLSLSNKDLWVVNSLSLCQETFIWPSLLIDLHTNRRPNNN